MNLKNSKIKILLVMTGVFVYMALLLYISSIQSDYNVQILTKQEAYTFSGDSDENYVVDVEINNQANRMLSSAEGQDIFLSYHLYDLNGNLICFDNIRSCFEYSIFSGDTAEAKLYVTPLEHGEYLLGIDIIQEYVTWFNEKEDTEKIVKITVE